jgi:hypothetical protein
MRKEWVFGVALRAADRRPPGASETGSRVSGWIEADRNTNHAKADWQFTTADARIKLKHLNPSI